MQLSFSELYKDTILQADVVIICGGHDVFNQVAISRLKELCRSECLEQLGVPKSNRELTLQALGNTIDLNGFMLNHSIPPFIGRWFCHVDLATLDTKQLEFVKNYIKAPSSHGILLIEGKNYREYKDFLFNHTLKSSTTCHALKLTYPNKNVLKKIVTEELKGVVVADKAMDLFILRMGEAYDEYETALARVKSLNLSTISYQDMKKALAGIEHFSVDDFLLLLLKPPRTKKTNKKAIVNTMYTLMGDIGASKLLYKIYKHVDLLVELRTYINKGYIPGEVKVSLSEFKERLDDDVPFKTMHDFVLGKKIKLALSVSLRDLVYLKLMIIQGLSHNDDTCEKTLYVIMTRALITPARLSTYLGCTEGVDRELARLNQLLYNKE